MDESFSQRSKSRQTKDSATEARKTEVKKKEVKEPDEIRRSVSKTSLKEAAKKKSEAKEAEIKEKNKMAEKTTEEAKHNERVADSEKSEWEKDNFVKSETHHAHDAQTVHTGHAAELNKDGAGNENSSETSIWKDVGTWRLAAIIMAALLILSVFTNGFDFGATGGAVIEKPITLKQAEQSVVDFIDSNLLQPGTSALLVGSRDVGDLYEIELSITGQQFTSYVTKDGRLLFPQGFNLNDFPDPSAQQPSAQIPLIENIGVDDDPAKGSADAMVTIIEFSDFQCPFCGRFYTETLPLIEDKYIKTGKVRLVYRDFPLDSIHPQARPAAEAAECADEQGKFWEFHDKLFENQGALNDANYKRWAGELGLEAAEFGDCIGSGKYASEVDKDFEDGAEAGVTGTPAFFVNGRMVSGAQPFSIFETLIDAELEAAELLPETGGEEEAAEDEIVSAGAENSIADNSIATTAKSLAAKRWRFVPNEIAVKEGDTVKLSIKSEDVDARFVLPDFGLDIGLIAGKTSTATFTADRSGTFSFSCADCGGKESVMRGSLVVE